MSSHGHSGPPAGPSAPEPSFAEQARTLVHLARSGTLGTLSRRHPGHPFVSVMPYTADERGRPLILISGLAMHTQNLDTDPRASLLVVQAGHEDPLAMARVTLMGRAERLPAAARATAREAYLARHPNAVHWVDYGDFAFWRLDLTDVYFVGGFGAMDWLTVDGYAAARPDPLADAAPGIVEHMNADHADALVLYCRAFADVAADEATMTGIDRMGFRVRARIGDRLQGLRINFPRDVRTPMEARTVLVEMVRTARQS